MSKSTQSLRFAQASLLLSALVSCSDGVDSASALAPDALDTGALTQASTDPLAVSPDAVRLLIQREVGERWVRPANTPIYEIAGIQLKDGMGRDAGAISIWSTTPSATNCRWSFDQNGVATQDGRLTEDGVEDPRIVALTESLRAGRDPGDVGLDLFTIVVGARRNLPPVLLAERGLPDMLRASLTGNRQCDWYSRVVDPSDGSVWVSCASQQDSDASPVLHDFAERRTLELETLLAHEAMSEGADKIYSTDWDELEAAVAPTPEELGGSPGLGLLAFGEDDALARGSDSLAGSMVCYSYNGSSYSTSCSTCSCSCGTNYGSSKGSLDGHTTYYDGSTCTGSYCSGTTSSGTAFRCWGAYQCVEYVKRFRHLSGTTGDAYYWWASNYSSSYPIRPLFKMANAGSYAPSAGDVLYSCNGSCGSSAGHVGILGSPSGSTIGHYDQNFTSASQPVSLTYSSGATYTIGNRSSTYVTMGWMRTGWEFYYSSSTPMYGWSPTNISTVSYGTSGSTTYARLTSMSSDPYMTGPDNLGVNPSTTYGGRYVSVRLRTNATNRSLRVYFITTSDTTWNETKAVSATIPSGTGWSTVNVDMSANTTWASSSTIVRQIRIDPISTVVNSSEYVDIDYVRFTSN